jgi:hypothetical protein
MRLKGARTKHVPSWTGPLIEDAEPDVIDGVGALDDGVNVMARTGGLREVRGGSSALLTLADVAGNAIDNVLGIFPYTATGIAVVAHSSAADKHYAYGLTDEPDFVTGTEATSRADMGWNIADPARPLGVELFEKLYVVDARITAARQGMAVLVYTGGAWSLSIPVYDLDGSGAGTAVLRAYSAEVFNGVLFVSGYDSETGGDAPHLVRHSLLGTDPAAAGGFDSRAYAIIGAKGQRVQAMRSGRSVMLVAKDNELYQISGTGRGLPGWQYGIQQVTNAVGAGCTNPYALDHALGYWYGMGRAGPWRSDGSSVESLLPPRRRSWRQLDLLELAFVRYHADRRQIWFGVPQPSVSGYVSAPNVAWIWDIDREQWDVNQRTGRSFHLVQGIAQSPELPAAPPSVVAQSWSYGEANADGLAYMWGTFTAGDNFAETEVWGQVSGSAYALQATLPAGVKRFRVVHGVGQEPWILQVKLRHLRNGAYSEFTVDVPFYSPIRPPLLQTWWRGVTPPLTTLPRRYQLVVNSANVTAYLDSDPARFSDTFAITTPAVVSVDEMPAGSGEEFEAVAERADWPISHRESVVSVAHVGGASFDGSQVCEPRQSYYTAGKPELTTIEVTWQPGGYSKTFYLEYRVLGSGSAFTIAATRIEPAFTTQELEPIVTTVTGLTAGTRYEFRVRNNSSVTSAGVTMYTALPAPTFTSATTAGAGTPDVDLDISVPQAGHGLRVYNAAQTYDNLTASASAGSNLLNSTAGVCGTGDRYFARTYDANWPADFRYSSAATADIVDPCVT